MDGAINEFWGKLDLRDDVVHAWHPLAHHCADVAACTEALLQRSLLRRRLARLAGRDDLDEVTVARLCVFAALHDLGKFNQHFQNKGRPGALPRAGHVRELVPLFDGANETERFYDALSALPLAAWSTDGAAEAILLAAVAHHGRPIPLQHPGVTHDPERWVTLHGLDPFDGMRRLALDAARWFPDALRDGPELPTAPEFQHGFAGLVMLADWLGSDRSDERFPFSSSLDDDRIAFARERAAITLAENHIAIGRLAAELDGEITYARFTDHAKPHDTQDQMLSLPVAQEGSLTILEAETGSGKTEASLAHFFRLFQAGVVEGMYFALPTRTAATQIHTRVVKAVQRLFAGCSGVPPVVLAVPGYLAVDDVKGERLPEFKVLWKDDHDRTARGQSVRHRGWAAEHPKRYLAASIAVGTIDQCLLSTLVTDHAHLRATTLSRSLLVVDEVHASDTYMTELLREVLAFHRASGGHALLMSATLGASARDRYLGARTTTPYAQARVEPYPRIMAAAPGVETALRAPSQGAAKTVTLSTDDRIDDPEHIARLAVDAALRGARVLVLRNTVRACLETQREVERIAPESLRFRVNGVDTAHHARFAKDDRTSLDKAIEAQLGKGSPAGGRIVVATQTVQQSLDLDADLLITDLCPVDVLLQRIGRLHRHTRARPEGFEAPRCVVLTPETDLGDLLGKDGKAHGKHGFGLVYDDMLVLRATLGEISRCDTWEIPKMNRALVEAATHPEALRAALPGEPRWKKHAETVRGAGLAHKRIARSNVIVRAVPFGDAHFPDLQAQTRLGINDRRVELPRRCQTAMGSYVSVLTIPAWMLRGVDEDTVADQLTQDTDAFSFRFGDRRYRYDRLGLHVADDTDPTTEDDA